MRTEDEAQFNLLTNLLAETIHGLRNIRLNDPRQADCEPLLLKLLQHTLSLRQLHNRPQPLPLISEKITVYDFPTGIVISRAAFETYLTLFDVFFSPETPEEFEFRYLLWRIRGYLALQEYDSMSQFGSDQYQRLMDHLAECRTNLQVTSRFQALTQGQQNTALKKGKDETQPPRDFKAAGFAEDVAKRIYGFSSSYVHSDGHAAYQIRSAMNHHDDQRKMFEMSISFALIFISLAILRLEKLFPAIEDTTNSRPVARGLVDHYVDLAVKMGDPAVRDEIRQQLRKAEEG